MKLDNNKSLIASAGKVPETLSLPERELHARVRTALESLQYRDRRRGGLARLFDRFPISIVPK
jgi:hypothetical protein